MVWVLKFYLRSHPESSFFRKKFYLVKLVVAKYSTLYNIFSFDQLISYKMLSKIKENTASVVVQHFTWHFSRQRSFFACLISFRWLCWFLIFFFFSFCLFQVLYGELVEKQCIYIFFYFKSIFLSSFHSKFGFWWTHIVVNIYFEGINNNKKYNWLCGKSKWSFS